MRKADLRPNMFLSEETRIITSPVTTCPTRTLIKKLGVILQSRLNLAFPIILNPGTPPIRNEPSSNEVVIVSIELILSPAFSLETFEEERTLQDLCTEETSTS